MAIKKRAKKSKPAKGGSVKQKVSKKSRAAKPAKGAKTSKLKKGARVVGGVVDRLAGAYTGSTLGDLKADFGGSKKSGGGSGRRHRKGVVPKTVRKWASKITRRRKQEEKIVKKLFGAEGGKIVKKPKASRYGMSPGSITKAEALDALRR